MAKLKHDNDGFLVGERADLGSETQLLEKISKDIAAIRAALSGNADSITASPQVKQAIPVEVSRIESSTSNREAIRERSRIVEVNPRLNQTQRSERSENRNQPENRVDSSSERVLLASLETVSNNLHDVHIDLSSMQNSLVNQSVSNNSVVNSRSASVLNSQSNEENNNERKEHRQSSHSNVAVNGDIRGINPVQQQGGESTRTSSGSNVGLQENNTNRNYVAEPSIRERDSNGRFIRKDKAESSEPKREVASPKGRDSNGRFTSGGGLGSGRGGEEGFISRLADRVGSAVGNTVSGDTVDEKFDPTVAAFKEVAEPIAKTFQFAGKLGGGVFNTLKTAVDFVPKISGGDKAEKTENNVSRNESATNTVLTANQTANSRIASTNNELSHSVNVENANLRHNVNASDILTNSNENNELRNNVYATEITHNRENSSQNTTHPSPASREVRTPPARINETTTAIPTLRIRDNRGRFVSANQPSAQTSTRQTGSSLIQNNVLQSRAIEPSRNTITSTNSVNGVNGVNQSIESTAQSIQSEPPVAETSQRGFFSRGDNNSNQNHKEKGVKSSFRFAIKEIIASRKEQSIYNKASLKLLKAIAGQETTVTGSGNSGGGFLSGLMGGLIPMVVAGLGALVAGVVGVFTGIGGMLLAGVTGVLGVIFSPIGLAIAAAGALAWGLFTEDGQKFFASIGDYISKGWDATTGFITENFSGVTEAANTFWKWLTDSFSPVTKVAGDLFDGLTKTWKDITDTISGIFDSFSTFLKDKFGIDIPAVVKTVVQPVADAANAAVDSVKETANSVADSAKNTASNLWDGAKDLAGKAVESTKNAVNPAYESVKKSVKDGTVLKDAGQAIGNSASVAGGVIGGIKDVVTGKASDRKAALITEMTNQGIADPKEQAMLMAQVDHESGSFKYTKELGSDSYFDKYDAGTKIGKNLGNTEKGDGAKYKGRGLIQLTGRANYTAASKDLGVDLVNHPELAEQPEMAAKTALWFWKKNKLSEKAKRGDVTAVTHTVNGGENGLADRKQKYAKYLAQAENGGFNVEPTKNSKPADTQVASAKPIEAESTLEKLSPISSAAASEMPANGGKVASEITAQSKGQDYFLGDSIAHGYRGKGEGDTVVGRNPAKILESMQKNLAENPDFYKGKNVHLSTGMSNNTGDTKSIEAQMKLLKESGANASVYGVSNNFKGDSKASAGYNKTLADLSEKYGFNFTGGFESGRDNVHPKSYSNDSSKNAAAQKSVEAGLDPEVLAKVNEPLATNVVEAIPPTNFSEDNSPAISQYAKTGKMPKKEAVSPAESQKTETATNSGYALQDDGEGGKSKIDLETLEVSPATPEEIAGYQSGTPAPEVKAQSTNQTPPQKTKEERDRDRLNWAMNTPEGLAAVEAGETLDVNALETKYNRTPDGQTITPADKLAALNTPEKIAERKKSGAGADEKERQQGERYKQKEITEPQTVTASSVNPAENSTIENAKPDSPIITDIKNRITPQADIAAQLAKNATPSIPNFASTVFGNAGGGIGEALAGKLPTFLSNPVSAITASVSAPSIPKMPSVPAVSEPPVIKEPLNTNNDSRQQLAVSYPQSEVGQDISDRRIAHLVSGGYSRG